MRKSNISEASTDSTDTFALEAAVNLITRTILRAFVATLMAACADVKWVKRPSQDPIVAESAAVFRVKGKGAMQSLRLPIFNKAILGPSGCTKFAVVQGQRQAA